MAPAVNLQDLSPPIPAHPGPSRPTWPTRPSRPSRPSRPTRPTRPTRGYGPRFERRSRHESVVPVQGNHAPRAASVATVDCLVKFTATLLRTSRIASRSAGSGTNQCILARGAGTSAPRCLDSTNHAPTTRSLWFSINYIYKFNAKKRSEERKSKVSVPENAVKKKTVVCEEYVRKRLEIVVCKKKSSESIC